MVPHLVTALTGPINELEQRVLALTMTLAESTSRRKRCACTWSRVTMASV